MTSEAAPADFLLPPKSHPETVSRASFKLRTAVALGSLLGGAVLGIGSAFYAFSSAGISDVPDQPGWERRSIDTSSSALTYVFGHYLANGQLPPPQSVMDLWRDTATDGVTLRGDCMTTLEGTIPPARWWTIAAVDKDGVAEGARSVLSASAAVLEADGHIIVHLSAEPQPGNWIAPASGGTYSLALTLHDPVLPLPAGEPLPRLTRVGC